MKYGTDRFIEDGVQSGLNHPKILKEKQLQAGLLAKLPN